MQPIKTEKKENKPATAAAQKDKANRNFSRILRILYVEATAYKMPTHCRLFDGVLPLTDVA